MNSSVFNKINDQSAIELSISFNGQNKRLSLEAIPSNNKQFTMINRKLSRLFKIEKGQEFVMQYIDSENDLITIGSAIEFGEAISQQSSSSSSSPLEVTLALKSSSNIEKPREKKDRQHHHFKQRIQKSPMEIEPIVDSTLVIDNAVENKDRFLKRIQKAESKFATQLQTLESMSLIGDSRISRLRCIRLLTKFDGDISRVIERLSSFNDQIRPTKGALDLHHQHRNRHGHHHRHHHHHHHHHHQHQARLERVKKARVCNTPLSKHEFQEVTIKFSQELAKLKELGYKRKRVLATLLNQHDGNIEAVLASLNTCC